MSKSVSITLVAFVLTALAIPQADAQVGPKIPAFKGKWNPVAGAGAAYLIQEKGQKPTNWEVAIVGKEAGGYWMEMSFQGEEAVIMKQLMTPEGIKRTIMKAGDEPAMEIPVFSAKSGSQPQKDGKELGKLLGPEKVTTPAGTFSCDHYRMIEGSKTTDVWVAPTVSPYGLVKMTSADMTMTLQKLIAGAKTRITEKPQKLEIPQQPGMPGAPGMSFCRERESRRATPRPRRSRTVPGDLGLSRQHQVSS